MTLLGRIVARRPPGGIFLVALLVVLATFGARHGAAYVPTRTAKGKTPVRWHNTNCVVIRPHIAGSSAVNNGSEFSALLRAMDNWHRATADCTYLRFVAANPLPRAEPGFARGKQNENVVHYVEVGWTHDAAATALTTVKFLAKPGHPADGKILDADIEMNGELFAFSGGDGTSDDTGATDIENTLTHELGHVIGLDHPCDDGTYAELPTDDQGQPIPACAEATAPMLETTMYNFADSGETKKRSPEADDIRGFCETYPRNKDPGRCAVLAVELDGGCQQAPLDNAPLLPLLTLLALLLARRGLAC